MKTGIFSTLAFATLGALAQQVDFVFPPPGTAVTAGQPFTATVAIQDTTSSLEVITLRFGVSFDSESTTELGFDELAILNRPSFDFEGPTHQQSLNVSLTIPAALNGSWVLTCGEFYGVGANLEIGTHISQLPVTVNPA